MKCAGMCCLHQGKDVAVLQRRNFLSAPWEMVSAAKSKLTSCPHYSNALIDGPDLVQPAKENISPTMFQPWHRLYPTCSSMFYK